MSELTTKNLKKRVLQHTPNDKIYLKLGRYTCPHCSNNHGPKKIFKHLWSLVNHISYHHIQRGDFA